MAKAAKKTEPMTVPAQFDGSREQHPYLKKVMTSWARQFKPTKMDMLYEAVNVANYLVALGRSPEAAALLVWLTTPISFSGNYNIWSPVGSGLVLLARLKRLDKDKKTSQAALDRIRKDIILIVHDGDLEKLLASHPEAIAAAQAETQKWGTQGMSRHLRNLTFYRETADKGFVHFDGYKTAPLDKAIDESYAVLAQILG